MQNKRLNINCNSNKKNQNAYFQIILQQMRLVLGSRMVEDGTTRLQLKCVTRYFYTLFDINLYFTGKDVQIIKLMLI